MTLAPCTRRFAALNLISPETLNAIRARSTLLGVSMIASAWAIIVAAIAMVALTPYRALLVITYPLAVALIGSRQLGLAILMHEGAHGGLAKSEHLNMALAQWLCAYPVFAETSAYRQYHLQHHAHAQTKRDPDLVLSAPFPVTRDSLSRKLWRDLTGRTGLKQRTAQVRAALGRAGDPLQVRAAVFLSTLGRPLAVNAAIWAAMAALGVWWAYPLLWLIPLLTWQQLATRIRNIAEHALLPVDGDPWRVARTTRAGPVARLFLAPYWVNYHAEHHLMMYVPCYRLPKLHEALRKRGLLDRLEVAPNYLTVLRRATTLSSEEA